MTNEKHTVDLHQFLPDTSSDLLSDFVSDHVTCYRDAYGIPHIKANNLKDAFFGQGFFTAQDRLFQMDMDRRKAYGRMSELIGPAGLATDHMMRKFQIADSGKSDYEALNDETKAMLTAYTAGVNAFLKTSSTPSVEYSLLDAVPEEWSPCDSLAVYKVRHVFMGVFESKLWRAKLVNLFGAEEAQKIMPTYPNGGLLIVPPGSTFTGDWESGFDDIQEVAGHLKWLEDVEGGSNNWVVSGEHTQSGLPLLAGDPHRALDTPNVYYQNHLACPAFDVIGFSFPGIPGFPHFAHNQDAAWAITHGNNDYQDLYIEKLDPERPNQYLYQDQWLDLDVKQDSILVKGGPAEDIILRKTIHGLVLQVDPKNGFALAFKYTALEKHNRTFDCLLPMMKAKTCDDLEEAVRLWVDPGNNMVFADRKGDIGYINRGKVPVRSTFANYWVPVPGWTGEYEWQGYVPFEELARSRNPETGFIVTANNRITDKNYPYTLGLFYAPDFRARRIFSRLSSLSDCTTGDMESIHAERESIPARILINSLSDFEPEDAFHKDLHSRLISWNYCMDADRIEPTLYSAVRRALNKMVLTPLYGPLAQKVFDSTKSAEQRHLGQLSTQLILDMESGDTRFLPPGREWPELVQQAFTAGVENLQEALGNDLDAWQWGKVHFTSPVHPLAGLFPELANSLNPPQVSTSGDGDTPQSARFRPGIPFVIDGTSVARYVFDLSDWDLSRWIVPLGSSGHAGSGHYADQAATWSKVGTIAMVYSWETLMSQAVSVQSVKPEINQ